MGVRGQPTKWDKWYSTARWARIQRHQLLEHPLCKYCAERGIVEPAAICDHVEPHHGDNNKFWLGPFQSLCKSCHDSTKRFVETRGFRPDQSQVTHHPRCENRLDANRSQVSEGSTRSHPGPR